MKKLFLNSTLLFICAVLLCCCRKDKIAPKKSAEKNISSFKISGVAGGIDPAKKTIQITLPAGTDPSALKPIIEVSAKATVSPLSGVAQDFSKEKGVIYKVTAEDGSTQDYTVTVKIPKAQEDPAPPVGTPPAVPVGIQPTTPAINQIFKSSEKKILSFKFSALTPEVIGEVEEGEGGIKYIKVKFPKGTNAKSLVPVITVSPRATLTFNSGETPDFSKTTQYHCYTVTAENGTSTIYTVYMQIGPEFVIYSLGPNPAYLGSLVYIKGRNFNYKGNTSKKEVILTDENNHSVIINKFEKWEDNEISFNIPDNIKPSTYSINVSIDNEQQQAVKAEYQKIFIW